MDPEDVLECMACGGTAYGIVRPSDDVIEVGGDFVCDLDHLPKEYAFASRSLDL